MKVTMILADYAEAQNGKLYIMGGGWSVTGPNPGPSAIAIKIEVPWTDTNRRHNLKVELMDSDFRPISVPTPMGESPLVVQGDFEVGRPPGVSPGTPMDLPFAFNIMPLPLIPGQRYIWRLSINGESDEEWQVGFTVREQRPQPAAIR